MIAQNPAARTRTDSPRVWHHPPQRSTNAATVRLGHVQVVLASVGHESGAHTAEHLEDCRHYKKHRSTSVSVVGCHFLGLWVSKSRCLTSVDKETHGFGAAHAISVTLMLMSRFQAHELCCRPDNVTAGIMPRLGAGKKLFLLYKCKYVASQLSLQLLR